MTNVTPVKDCQGSYGGLYTVTLNGQDRYMKLFNDSLNPNEKEHIIYKIRQFVETEWHVPLDAFTSFPGQLDSTLPHTSNPCGYYINYYEQDQDRSNIATRLKQAVIAIQRLQQKTWIHGDIKLANIVFPNEADHNDKAILIDLEDPCNLYNWRNKGNSNVVMFSPITMNPVYIHYRQWTMSRPGATAKTINDAVKLRQFIGDYKQFHDIIYLNCCQQAVQCNGFKDVITLLLDAAVRSESTVDTYIDYVCGSVDNSERLYKLLLYSDLFSLAMSCLVEGRFWTVLQTLPDSDFKVVGKTLCMRGKPFLTIGWNLLCSYFRIVQQSVPPIKQLDACAQHGGSPFFYMKGGVGASTARFPAANPTARFAVNTVATRLAANVNKKTSVTKVDIDEYITCFSKASVMFTTTKDGRYVYSICFPPDFRINEKYPHIIGTTSGVFK
jgi:hypothetical protein